MSIRNHLFCRNNQYYFRIKIPKDLQHFIPIREIKKTLKTTEYKIAISLAILTTSEIIEEIRSLRKS